MYYTYYSDSYNKVEQFDNSGYAEYDSFYADCYYANSDTGYYSYSCPVVESRYSYNRDDPNAYNSYSSSYSNYYSSYTSTSTVVDTAYAIYLIIAFLIPCLILSGVAICCLCCAKNSGQSAQKANKHEND